MKGKEIDFSMYASTFYEIICGKKNNKAEFVKELLKTGQTSNGKKIIEEMFPTITTSKGKTIIKKNKADQLRKYLRGDNGIGDIACELEANFDEELYSKELQDYEDSRLLKFAQRFNLDADTNETDEISEAIAELYFSIIEASATKKGTKSKKSNVKPKSNGNSISLSYTITETEKAALINLCKLIRMSLRDLEKESETISKKHHELKNLTDSEADKRWKPHLEYDIRSHVKHFEETYPKIEKLCIDLNELLDSKKDIDPSVATLISVANNIKNVEYRSIYLDKYDYRTFWRMISQFNDKIDRVLRVIDKL